MTSPFSFSAPTRVLFGVGERKLLPNVLKGGAWGLLSTPHILARSGFEETVRECQRSQIRFILLGRVSPNPRLAEIDLALDLLSTQEVEGIVAVGGGSVMDAGKLLRVAYEYAAPATDVLADLTTVIERPRQRRCHLVVIPTTAGTGAEVSKGAIVTDGISGRKLAARGDVLIPDAAVIDPELTVSLPPRRTAETGFDVIAHAVETYLSSAATLVTDVFALSALENAPGALVRALEDGRDIQARTVLSLYSWLMGYNLAHATTCLPHRMQYPIGALTDTSHQIGLAALYVPWVRAVAPKAPDRMREIVSRLSRGLSAAGALPAGPADAESVFVALLDRLGIRVSLNDLGIQGDQVDQLTSMVEGRVDVDPLKPTLQDMARLYRESMA